MTRKTSQAALWLGLAAVLAVDFLARVSLDDERLRRPIDVAGDDGLPGSAPLQDWRAIRAFSERIGESGAGYLEYLARDDLLAGVQLAGFLAVVWLAWRSVPRALSFLLAGAAALYAASDWVENALLRSVLGRADADSALYVAASLAASAKWALLSVSAGLAIGVLVVHLSPWRAWFFALFHDVPFFIDAAWRRLEFRLNREFLPAPSSEADPLPRPFWRLPPFWLFCATVIFVCYGPTLDGVCSLSPAGVHAALLAVAVALLVLVGWAFFWKVLPWVRQRVRAHHFVLAPGREQEDRQYLPNRRVITQGVLLACGLLLLAPVYLAAAALSLAGTDGICQGAGFSLRSLTRLVLCAGVIAAFAAAWSRKPQLSTAALVAAQAALLVLAGAIHWFELALPEATEASRQPYRHLFAVIAPAAAVLLALAPALARLTMRSGLAAVAEDFRRAFAQRELFVAREPSPIPTWSSVTHALLYGAAYRVLQFALLPSLLALVAPPDSLWWMAGLGLLLSIGLSTWGNLFPRWRHMALYVERWFLSGTAFFVSLFVIAVALARVYGVSYVTTILDGAPFGVVFLGTLMCYVLSWLIEYWINRVAASELLRLLGEPGGRTTIPYPYAPAPGLQVERSGRHLMHAGIGRFVVTGRLPGRPDPAFHGYALTELFEELSREAKPLGAMAVTRHVHLYFYAVNALLLLAAAVFASAYWYFYRVSEPDAVVIARADADAGRLNDLAERLLASPGEADRPAVVVVASGGGTRAAVYTAHVLEGLHGIGADRDVVLASGVSGGGVALAYFALHFEALSQAGAAADPLWKRFKDAVAANYIDDVMQGASEWRLFGPAPLSVLLAETFARRLFPGATLELPQAPALILNTTIAGHPVEDSALLTITLNRPPPANGCGEAARPYKIMSGGRLIFTNLKQAAAFPGRDAPIPDLRLPYEVVRDPGVPLAAAAALNANFPPVFPNARVLLRNRDRNSPCPDRSYHVTDGGAEENLGLVSALYALQSALEEIAIRCGRPEAARDAWCARKLRPIHVVIAEASATGYDYRQDRGLSAALEGAKERLTGELTNQLIKTVNGFYLASPAARDDERRVRYHFLAMPLAFRSRGGIGTHWTHSETVTLSDPRVRSAYPDWTLRKVSVSWGELTRIWKALHHPDPDRPYCTDDTYGSVRTDQVRRWICGSMYDANRPRDLHVLEWPTLLRELRPR